jgi:transcriptional antiterminator NusG
VSGRRICPGYVLGGMDLSDETWHLVKSTNRVAGFLGGSGNRPAPISEREVEKILSQMEEGVDKPRPKVLFEVGETVRFKEGPFADFNGNVEEVNYEKSKVRVSVTIFGRATPVELDFSQVEKV